MTNQFSPKIQIVSRYLPYEHIDGQSAYLLDMMRYLRKAGCELELVVLHPAFATRPLPKAVQDIAHVFIREFPKKRQQNSPLKVLRANLISVLRFFLGILPGNWQRVIRTVRQLLFLSPAQMQASLPDEPPTMEEVNFFRERFAQFHPQVVIANYTFLGGIFDCIAEPECVLKIVLAIDIMSQRVQSYRQAGISYHWSAWSQEQELVQLRHADMVAAIQQKEAQILTKLLPEKEIFYLPMSSRPFFHHKHEQIPGRCLFVAGGSDHNIRGLQWFLTQVWPHIVAHDAHVELHVCGTVCEKVEGHFPKVALMGRLDDLAPEYAAASVCIIPLIVGSGLKIKLVEALSHGRACVATSVGIQGMQELREKAVLVANTPQDFAHAVITVLTDADKRRAMEAQARRYVIEKLSPEKTYQPFVERIYEHVAQQQQKREKT